jgi:hypothetical protein
MMLYISTSHFICQLHVSITGFLFYQLVIQKTVIENLLICSSFGARKQCSLLGLLNAMGEMQMARKQFFWATMLSNDLLDFLTMHNKILIK